MRKRYLQYLFVSALFVNVLLLCMWNIKINQISNHELDLSASRTEETPDGWKFKKLTYNLVEEQGRYILFYKFNVSTLFPVDMVYTWVNGSDSRHRTILERFKKKLLQSKPITTRSAHNLNFQRFADNGGLRYSLRSLEKYANWIRHVFLVTNGQIPNWLNSENPRVTIVKHEEIFDNPEDLPTFSSHAIEHNIYKIRGLSETFIYMNDDMFFGCGVSLEDFYTEQNGTKVYLAYPAQTTCNTRCKTEMIKNDVCDKVCNYDHCAWDGGDCDNLPERQRPKDTGNAHEDYFTSIFYTNAIYNRAFGRKERRRTVHWPLLIEKPVNRDMVKRFPSEVAETCRHQMRSPLDFQFGFSYVHFLMEGNNNSKRFDIKILSSAGTYVAITSNVRKTSEDLKLLLRRKRKFICINDVIDYSKPAAAAKTIALLQSYYASMFPKPSSFERTS